ncbi:MAG: putative LPS assembly protein LptD [Flavobacterium sp.]|nr:putative LPS assembly protein LptD [Flavobacterium sp.]
MNKQGKINEKKVWAIVASVVFFIVTMHVSASVANKFHFSELTNTLDTVPKSRRRPIATTLPTTADTIKKFSAIDSATKAQADSINTIDTLTISKDSLDAPIKYKASDSGVLIIPTKEFILYGKANVSNKDVTLDAATIKYDQTGQMVKAYGSTDTTGNPNSKPNLIQGDMKTISDSILFSLKTFKGLTKNTYVQQGEMFIHSDVSKKVSANEYYGYRNRFTTCNLDTPHFSIRSRKIKMISNKLAVSGPASPEFEGVPIPIGIPFGIYPLVQGRHSGILPPAFTVSEDYGLGLEGLGYYKVISEYIDVVTRANLYSYGGWNLNVSPKYQKRYRFNGGLNITFQNTKALNRSYGFSGSSLPKEEFNSTKSYSINWQHSQDARVRPGTNFSASVNFASSRYNQTVLNNPYLNFQNQLSSTINYSKDFRGKANLSVSANHNQNNTTRFVNLSLPNIGFNANTFYPFQKKESVGTSKWYEKLGVGYSGSFSNQISYYDTASITLRKLLDTTQWAATHNIPISLALPALGAVIISPNISYSENWYAQKTILTWNNGIKRLDTSMVKGLYRSAQMSFGVSANTRIFGTYLFKKSKNIVAIRHEIRPTIGFTYTPDLSSKFFYNVQVDTLKHFIRVSQFGSSGFGGTNAGSISFGIDNLLEMKVRDRSDSTKPKATKKVKLIDGFGFSSSYNLLADSFKLATFQFYARTTLFDVVNITGGFTLDPYQVDATGFRRNLYTWNATKPSLGRLTSGNIALSTQFKSKPKDAKKDSERMPVDPYLTPDEQQRQLQYARSNPAEFTDFNIPWSLSLSYSLNYTKSFSPNYKYETQVFSSVNFSGDFSLTEKWKIGGNGYYDFNTGVLQQFSMFVTREMHCWQLAINVSPLGLYRSFNITISPKSGILRDLKINRTRTFSNY